MKKILCLLLSLILIFATFNVVAAEPNPVPNSVSVMQQLGYIEGDENGELNLEKSITRAEFAAMITRVLDFTVSGYATQIFSDVPADHWAAGYIATCAGLEIINGYGNGNFGPEDVITYEQAIKMVVCALGYEPMAVSKGGYPTGYLATANLIKITEDVKDNTRESVITLVYNALTTPKMAQTSFGSETVFEALDKYNNYTTILTEKDIYVATGIVTDVNAVKETFDFSITEASDDYNFNVGNYTFNIGNSNIADYKNESVVVYLQKTSRNKYEAVATEPSFASEILAINASDLETTHVGGNAKWEYYENINSYKTTKIAVNAEASVYVNGVLYEDASDRYFERLASEDAIIRFIENNGDMGYDIVDVVVYEHAIVEEVNAARGRIECLNGSRISYDVDDSDVVVKIFNANNEEIDLYDISTNDVLAIIVKEIGSNGMPVSARNFTDEMVIYNLGKNYIEGTIYETEEEENLVYIDGEGFEYNDVLVSEKDFFKNGAPKLGTEGIFYLGINGKIIGFDGVSGVSGNYAFVLQGAKDNSAWDDRYQVKLLLSNGKIETYYIDEDVVGNFNIAKWTNVEDASARVIEYKLNSKGIITELEFVRNAVAVNNEFKEVTSKIDGKMLASDVVIFNVDVTNADDACVVGLDYLVDEGVYGGYVLVKDDEYEIFVMTSGAEKFDAEAPIFVVDNVVKSTYKDEDCYKVTYYNNEYKHTAIFTSDAEKYNGLSLDYETLKRGSLFVASTATDGLVNKYMVLANVNAEAAGYDATGLAERFTATYSDSDVSYEYAQIDTIDKKYITLKGVSYDVVIGSTSAQYYFNADGTKPVIELGDWCGYNVEEGNNNYAFIKLYDGEVTDIIVFSAIN